MKPFLRVALLLLGSLFATTANSFAVDEATINLGATSFTLHGVVYGAGQYFDLDLHLVGASLSLASNSTTEFELTRQSAVETPGAISYDTTTGKLVIPSLRYMDGTSARRYSLELTISSKSPVRFKISQSTASTWTYSDSADSTKVASWLRAAAPADNATSHFSVIGVQSLNPGLGAKADAVLKAQGPVAMYQDAAAMTDARSGFSSKLAASGPVMQAGGITMFRDVQNVPWGLIEPAQGTYNYALLDSLIQSYQAYGVDYVADAMPFASWDLASRGAAAASCLHFFDEDYEYLAAAGKMDRYVNLNAFATMIQNSVERYDGDGVNDMAGLLRPVKYWQIQNEPEGSSCGQFRNDVPSFVELMKRSYAAVKAACADCQVLNGGVTVVDKAKVGGTFWWDFAAQGGVAYVDIIAGHFNDGKTPGTTDAGVFESFIRNLKGAFGSSKPIWITEFGVNVNVPGGQFASFTETQAAAWYTRFYTVGLNGGVQRFFSDASSFFSNKETTVTLLLPYYTNQLLESKLGGFSSSTRLADGQYRFTVKDSPVYVLWNGVPSELTGTVTSFDIYGTETKGDASSLKPTESLPLIVVK